MVTYLKVYDPMPIYEYRCDACGHEFERLQKISEDLLQECPDCGEKALKKLVSAAGFRLKGGGWYETDFKKGNKKNLHDSAGGKAKDGTGGKVKDSAKDSAKGSAPAPSKSDGGKS